MSQMREAERLVLQFQGLFGKPDGKAEDHAGGAAEDNKSGAEAKAEERPLARLRPPATPAQAMTLPSSSGHVTASLQAAPPAPRAESSGSRARAGSPGPREEASSGSHAAPVSRGMSIATKEAPFIEDMAEVASSASRAKEPGPATAAPATEEAEAIYHGKAPDTLIFKGGGNSWAVPVGITRRMEEAKLLRRVSTYIGVSGGAQVAALLAFGYSSQELEAVAKSAPPRRKLLDHAGFPCGSCGNVLRLFAHFGICKGNALEGYLDGLFRQKYGRSSCTFRQLYNWSGKELRLGVCNLVTRQFEFLDRHTHPHMTVCAAARASSSLPVLFRPVRVGRALYVDGGMEPQLPISAFRRGKQALGFNLVEAPGGDKKQPANFLEFLGLTVHMLKESVQDLAATDRRRLLRADGVEVLNVDIGKARAFDADLSAGEFDLLMKCGYDEVARYLRAATE